MKTTESHYLAKQCIIKLTVPVLTLLWAVAMFLVSHANASDSPGNMAVVNNSELVTTIASPLTAEASESSWHWASEFNRGGELMWVMLVMSILGLAFFLERTVSLRRKKQIPVELDSYVTMLWRSGDPQSVQQLLTEKPSVLASLIRGVNARPGLNQQELEQSVQEDSGRELWSIKLGLRVIGLIPSLAPLLGLLGTVIGLIDAFRQVAVLGMDNPSVFTEGIYTALYTTAFGLIIAIPFTLLHQNLRNRCEKMVLDAEVITLKLIPVFLQAQSQYPQAFSENVREVTEASPAELTELPQAA